MDRRDPQSFGYTYLKNGVSEDMNVYGSSTSVDFDYTVGDNSESVFSLERINFVLVDTAIKYGSFGGVAALTNGCLLQIKNPGGSVIEHFGTDEVPLKTNEDFGALAGRDSIISPAAGDDSFPVRFTLSRAGGPMALSVGDQIVFTVQDDLTGLAKFRAMAQGLLS